MVHGDRVTKTVGRDFYFIFYGRLFFGGGRGGFMFYERTGGYIFGVDPGRVGSASFCIIRNQIRPFLKNVLLQSYSVLFNILSVIKLAYV
jgi:hypothetical protein